VRVHLADALSQAKPVVAVQVLCRMVKQEEDPRATWAVIRATGCIKEQSVKKALLAKWREHTQVPLSPKAVCELAIALGKQGGDDVLEVLLMGLRDADSISDIEYTGFVRGLASHHSRRAFDVLLAMSPYGAQKRWKCRAAGAEALAQCAEWQEHHLQLHAAEQLRRLLHDQSERVQKAAAAGLAMLRVQGTSADIEALRATLPHQDHAWLERLKLEAVCPRSNPDADAKCQVEFLTSRVHELEDKLNRTLTLLGVQEPHSSRQEIQELSAAHALGTDYRSGSVSPRHHL